MAVHGVGDGCKSVSIRLARHLTGRPKVLVFNYCYHGTVDEAFASLDSNGRLITRPWNLGPPVPLSDTTRVVEFNDVEGAREGVVGRGRRLRPH